MRWHRLIFWTVFIVFSVMTIAAETGHVQKEGMIKFLLFVLCTGSGIFVMDALVRRWFAEKKYSLFISVTILVGALFVLLQMGLEYLLLGAHPLGWKEKLLENVGLIMPWMIIASAIFIAEDFGKQKLVKTRAELLYLKHQVNPHFLLNTHNNINFLIEQDPALASVTLLKLSKIMQYMLYECSADMVPLSKELNNLANYIELEKIRKNDKLQISYDFLHPANLYSIAPLLLITFVENAFKHVSNFKDRENYIRATAEVKDNKLHFCISNSKQAKVHNEESGIGLQNVKQRLRLLYRRRHRLMIEDVEDKYTAHLTIDLI